MKMKILGTLAAIALLSACASEPESTGSDTGAGTSPQPTTTTTPRPAPSTTDPSSYRTFVAQVGDRVFFDFDRYDLDQQSQQTLQRQAQFLQKFSSVAVIVEGHCDERGTREYNLALGERRANAVKDYLVALGIAPSRIDTISYGKERPANPAHNADAWAENRRGVTAFR